MRVLTCPNCGMDVPVPTKECCRSPHTRVGFRIYEDELPDDFFKVLGFHSKQSWGEHCYKRDRKRYDKIKAKERDRFTAATANETVSSNHMYYSTELREVQ